MDDKTIKNVSCEVDTCEHHTIDNKCSAPSIKVTSYGAESKEETDCSTFKKKF